MRTQPCERVPRVQARWPVCHERSLVKTMEPSRAAAGRRTHTRGNGDSPSRVLVKAPWGRHDGTAARTHHGCRMDDWLGSADGYPETRCSPRGRSFEKIIQTECGAGLTQPSELTHSQRPIRPILRRRIEASLSLQSASTSGRCRRHSSHEEPPAKNRTDGIGNCHRVSSRASHARASFQSRITLCGEIWSTWAVCSTLRPPKKRSSITFARLGSICSSAVSASSKAQT
jgi:hypothetical protein